ncbi:MAG TPA: peptide chain release factor N(5)-glutamine methyltransferase [Candidatus Eisenbacteria bacterium]|nr:peptide chain release factor N(5)-glutamine methyltransferase [Candidatus Eisenbacteria bacterium]
MEARKLTACKPAALTLRQIQRAGGSRLAQAGIPSALLDADVLLGPALGLTREQRMASPSLVLSEAQARLYSDLIERRTRREPIAYILGRQEFWSLDFRVTQAVLIPRPETERLVEIALEIASRPEGPPSILDIGTGSGAIAVSLATELPDATIWATDVSVEALALARGNAWRHGVDGRIHFLQGDLWEALDGVDRRFDLIVSNPPYVPSAEIDRLEPEVSRWEPRLALDGGIDGLDFYRRMVSCAHARLAPGGVLALEIGADMGAPVVSLFQASKRYREVKVVCDYAGRDRVVVARTG